MLIPTSKPTDEQKEYTRNFMGQGWVESKQDFKGDDKKRYIGMLGQLVICDLLGIKRPENKGIDNGFDIVWANKTWDVKTEIRWGWFRPLKFTHNLYAKQLTNKCDGYIFLNYNQTEDTFEICGAIEKEEFKKFAVFYPGGTERLRTDGTMMIIAGEGMYELNQKHLYKIEYSINHQEISVPGKPIKR